MTDAWEAAPNDLELRAREQLRAAIKSEQQASWVAALVPIGLWLWVLRHPILPAFAVLIALMGLLRSRAFTAIDRGQIERAVVIFMVGKWTISIALAFVLPIALPIVVVNLIMPIALGSTNLSSRRFVPMIVASVAVAFVAAALGYTTNLLALDEEVTPWVWQWLCVIVLAVHFVPLSVILWRSNQQQALTYNEAINANVRLRAADDELRRSRRRLVGAADVERSRIERDLHDGAQQRLVSVLVQLRLANRQQQSDVDIDPAPGAALADELEAAIEEIRALAHGIYPPLLKSGGLQRALAAVGRRSVADVVVEATDVDRYAPDVEAAVYFCCLEALQNAVKHGGAEVQVCISLDGSAERLVGKVIDDGPGFDSAEQTIGMGVQNMADRIGAVGGVCVIDSTPGIGTTVSFDIDVESEAP